MGRNLLPSSSSSAIPEWWAMRKYLTAHVSDTNLRLYTTYSWLTLKWVRTSARLVKIFWRKDSEIVCMRYVRCSNEFQGAAPLQTLWGLSSVVPYLHIQTRDALRLHSGLQLYSCCCMTGWDNRLNCCQLWTSFRNTNVTITFFLFFKDMVYEIGGHS